MFWRIRSVAGLVALLALTVSFAESVWASTCAPMMEMGGEAETTMPDTRSGVHCPRPDAPAGGSDDREGERSCPFSSSAAAQACTGVASMPAHDAPRLTPWSAAAADPFTVDSQPDLLLETALFRPPRA